MTHQGYKTRLVAGGLAALLGTAGLTMGIVSPAVAADCTTVPWANTALTPDERADALLSASTQHQKYRWLVEQPANSPAQTTFEEVTYPAQVDCTPTVVYTDGPDGVRFTEGVTAFPAPIAFAAAWDLPLAEAKGSAQGDEAFDKGKNGVLSPGLASGRTPLSGRTPEYFGEDSLLSGRLAASSINGLQSNPDKPVMADLKHYIANEQELDRQTSSSNLDERTFRQVYDLPVAVTLAESAPASVMCSYNQINGVFGCENPILNDVLKGEHSFDGYVLSDFGAVHSTAAALNNGLDQELNRPVFFTPTLLDEALTSNQITQERIDQAAKRVITAYIANGLFDKAVPEAPVMNASTVEHKDIARQAAAEGSVLLRNEGVLPLSLTAGQTIAVIGATASNAPTDGISALSVCSMNWFDGSTLNCENNVAPLDALKAEAAKVGAEVVFDAGTDVTRAAAVAAAADVAVVFGYQRTGEFADLTDLRLQGGGDALITAVAAANENSVVVLNTGSAVEMPWLKSTGAVIESWLGGEQFGPALAGILFGEINPSGKLPMTFPKSIADAPANTPSQYPGTFADGSIDRPIDSTEIRQVDYTEGLQVGYKWYDEQNITPLFEFGHGLSYTSFSYSDLAVSQRNEGGNVVLNASVAITNTGDRAGTEIPQVYLTLPESAEEPGKRLVSFDKVDLNAGETKTVTFTIDSAAANKPLSVWNSDADQWQIAQGGYVLDVAASSRDLRQSSPLTVDLAGIAPTIGVTLDPVAPNGSNGWYKTPVTITATGTDDIDTAPTLEVSVNDGSWSPYTEFLVIDNDGTSIVQVRATDNAGNVSQPTSATITLDRTAPTVASEVDEAKRTIALTGADATSGMQTLEYAQVAKAGQSPASWVTYSGAINAPNRGITIAYRATDVAGNISQTEYVALRAKADTAPVAPVPGMTSPSGLVKPAPSRTTPDSLAATGTETWPLLAGGGMLLLVGAAFLSMRNHRTEKRG